jgi:O-antigen ligase
VVLYAAQAAYSADVSKALEQVVFFYIPFALLFALLRELEWTRGLAVRALGVLVGLALVFAAIGFVEYQQRHLLLNPKVIASNQFESYFRVNSLFFDPNIYGRFLAMVMIGLAAVLLWEKRVRTQWIVAGILAVLWGGLLLTLSQSSFVALLAGLAILAALRWQLRRTLYAAAAAVLLAVVVIVAFPSVVRVDLGSSASLNNATSGRYGLISGGVALARAKPVFGWGTGSFSRQFRSHERSSPETAASASHTIPITVAAEQGLVGLGVYLALLVAAMARLFRGAARSPERAAIAAAFCALVLHTWLYASFLEDPLAWALLAVGTALAPPRS